MQRPRAWYTDPMSTIAELPPDQRLTGRSAPWALVPFLVLIALGSILRIAYFRADTSLWGDEAGLALNLQQHSYRELAQPLGGHQQAPYLFLLIEKALFSRFGLNEHWLRAPALFSSLASLVLFPWVARKVISTRGAIIGTALFALCPSLVRYSAELKPYAGDALASLIVCGFGVGVINSRFSRAWLALFALVGALLAWASYPCVFVLFGVGTALLVDRLVARKPSDMLACAAMVSLWLASFAAVYIGMARHSVADHSIELFWDYAFAPLPPRSLWDLRHASEILVSPFVDPLGLSGVGLGGALFVLGSSVLFVVNWRLAVFCVLPIMAAFFASAVHAYPFATRLLLFIVPLLIMPLAEGAARLASSPLPRNWTYLVLAGFLLAAPGFGVRDLLGSPERSGVRDVLSAVAGRAASGDALYVYWKAATSFRLYRQRFARNDVDIQFGIYEVREGQRVTDDLRQLSGHRRVWFLFSEVHTFFVDEEKLMLAAIERRGTRLDMIVVGPTRAYLYESASGEWIQN
jgi:hypothetical protein